MFNGARMSLTRGLKVTCLLLACCMVAWATVPQGWYLAGDKPADYESGVDSQKMHNGHPSAYLKGKKPEIDGFGTLMQDFQADQYVGKRLRFSAFVKSEGLENWAGFLPPARSRVPRGQGRDLFWLDHDAVPLDLALRQCLLQLADTRSGRHHRACP